MLGRLIKLSFCGSLVDTSVVGTRSARELAALGPGTMLCDGNAYIFTFLAAASMPLSSTTILQCESGGCHQKFDANLDAICSLQYP